MDFVAEMVHFHGHSGIRHFIIANVGSEKDVLQPPPAPEGFSLEYITHHGNFETPEIWLQKLTQDRQKRSAPQWVITANAGEFWTPKNQTLKDFLCSTPRSSTFIAGKVQLAIKDDDGSVPHPRNSAYFEKTDDIVILRKSAPRNTSTSEFMDKSVELLDVFTFPKGHTIAPPKSADEDSISAKFLGQELTVLRLKGQAVEDRRVAIALEREKWPIDPIDSTLAALAQKAENLISSAYAYMLPSDQNQVPASTSTTSKSALYNLPFWTAGAYRQATLLRHFGRDKTAEAFVQNFTAFRDVFSLFPRNNDFHNLLKQVAQKFFKDDLERLNYDTCGKTVILHLSCASRLDRAIKSVESFGDDESLHHIIITGIDTDACENGTPFSFSYNGIVLTVPVPDNYDSLHRKVFYGYLLFSLLKSCPYIVKIDDDIHLGDKLKFLRFLEDSREQSTDALGYVVLDHTHVEQLHGWHVGKVEKTGLNNRGYQYPIPQSHPAGGYGYILSPSAISACSSMYLSMKAFFDIDAIGLEDVYVGHALQSWNLKLTCLSDIGHKWGEIPGLVVSEEV